MSSSFIKSSRPSYSYTAPILAQYKSGEIPELDIQLMKEVNMPRSHLKNTNMEVQDSVSALKASRLTEMLLNENYLNEPNSF